MDDELLERIIERQTKACKERDKLISDTAITFRAEIEKIAKQYSGNEEHQKFFINSAIQGLCKEVTLIS
jgi:hypothetical protein